ncbi:molybdate ABC transporter substrate-binding protein [soil metagenome]
MKNRTVSPVASLALSLVAALALAGCGSGDSSPPSGSGGGKETGTLTVLGAASLTETFTTLAKEFEADHPGVQVKLSFDSSATLAEQVTAGAPADMLATADEDTMQTVVDANAAEGDPQVFATNHLQMVVPPKNPAGIAEFSDLDKAGVKYVVCVDTARCGKLAVKVLAATGIKAEPVSEEVDVKAVLSKVELDEADAGLVYATDAVAGGDKVKAIDVPTSDANLNTYPIAALADAKKPQLAQDWVDLVTGSQGRQVLADAGFGKP